MADGLAKKLDLPLDALIKDRKKEATKRTKPKGGGEKGGAKGGKGGAKKSGRTAVKGGGGGGNGGGGSKSKGGGAGKKGGKGGSQPTGRGKGGGSSSGKGGGQKRRVPAPLKTSPIKKLSVGSTGRGGGRGGGSGGRRTGGVVGVRGGGRGGGVGSGRFTGPRGNGASVERKVRIGATRGTASRRVERRSATQPAARAGKDEKPPISLGVRVLVTNLPRDMSEEEVRMVFESSGAISSVTMNSGNSATIVYRRRESAKSAVEEFDNRVIEDRRVRVNIVGAAVEVGGGRRR